MKTNQKKITKQTSSKAIANNPKQYKDGVQQGLSIQDNRTEKYTSCTLTDYSNGCHQRKKTIINGDVIQCLKKYSGDINSTEPETINVENSSYEDLCEYLAYRRGQEIEEYFLEKDIEEQPIWLKGIEEGDLETLKKARGFSLKEYYFEAGDKVRIKELISDYEKGENSKPKVDTVNCKEGEIKVADTEQKGYFGLLSSCVTITVYLENGKKVLAHLGLKMPIKLVDIKSKIQEVDSPVREIFVSGVLGWWSKDLVPIETGDSLKMDVEGFKENLRSKLGDGEIYLEDTGAYENTHKIHERSTLDSVNEMPFKQMHKFWVKLPFKQQYNIYRLTKRSPDLFPKLKTNVQIFLVCNSWASDLANMYGWAGTVEKKYELSDECVSRAKQTIAGRRNPPSYIM